MGAYGALVCTKSIKLKCPSRYILFSLESPLLLPMSKSIDNEAEINKHASIDVVDTLVEKRGVLFFGEYDLVDSFTATRIRELYPNFLVIGHRASLHNVAQKLDEDWSFKDYFCEFINENYAIVNSGSLVYKVSSTDLLCLIVLLGKGVFSRDILMRCIKNYPDFGYALNRLGVMYHDLGEIELAKQYIKKSLAINPDFENSKFHLKILSGK